MKIKEMSVLLGLFLVCGLLQAQTLDSSVEVTMYATVCPAFEAGPAVWVPFAQNVLGFWEGTVPEFSNITPLGFHALTSGSWRYVLVDTKGKFPIWLGEATPGVQRGSALVFPFRIVSTNPIALSDIKFTFETWEKTGQRYGSIGYVIDRFWENTFGILPTGEILTSGDMVDSPAVKEIRSVGVRFTFSASSQEEINALIEDCPVFSQVSGVSCKLEVFQSGKLIAVKQLDLPFDNLEPAKLQVNGTSIRVDGATNQQYRLQSKSMLAPSSWQTIGLPIFSGSDVSMSDTADTASMFRVFQGEP